MDRMESQRVRVQRYLMDGNSITPIEALNMFGAFRFSSIIYELKNYQGMDIETEMVFEENGKRYAKYYLKK